MPAFHRLRTFEILVAEILHLPNDQLVLKGTEDNDAKFDTDVPGAVAVNKVRVAHVQQVKNTNKEAHLMKNLWSKFRVEKLWTWIRLGLKLEKIII